MDCSPRAYEDRKTPMADGVVMYTMSAARQHEKVGSSERVRLSGRSEVLRQQESKWPGWWRCR